MDVLSLYEGFFQYVCGLNRMGRTEGSVGAGLEIVQSEVLSRLEAIEEKSKRDHLLNNVVRRLELPAIYFVDSIIATSRLPFANDWHHQRLAVKPPRNAMGGDEEFFKHLEETLSEDSDEAMAALSFYYVCLGLGFTGFYTGKPDALKNYMDRIYTRIKHLFPLNPNAPLSPDAEDLVDTRDLRPPEDSRTPVIIGVLAFFIIISVFVYYGMYMWASDDLREALVFIQDQVLTQ